MAIREYKILIGRKKAVNESRHYRTKRITIVVVIDMYGPNIESLIERLRLEG